MKTFFWSRSKNQIINFFNKLMTTQQEIERLPYLQVIVQLFWEISVTRCEVIR